MKTRKFKKNKNTPFFSKKEKYALKVTLSAFLFEVIIFVFILFFSNFNSYNSVRVDDIKPSLATEKLIDELKSVGFKPSIGQKIKRNQFSVEGILIRLGQDNIQVFEYPDRESALSEGKILSQKYTSTSTLGLWKNTKHVYIKDKMLVFYMGTEKNILDSMDTKFLTANTGVVTNNSN